MTLPCPVCAEEMSARETEEQTIRGCGRCGGIWLDIACSGALMAGELPRSVPPLALAVHQFAWNMQQKASSYREAPLRVPDGPRRCPECRSELVQTRVFKTEIDVDVCGEHGTYFDPTELGMLDDHFRIKKAHDEAAAKRMLHDMAAADFEAAKERVRGGAVVFSLWGIPILRARRGSAWDL